MNLLWLCRKLMEFNSVTPSDSGAFDFLYEALKGVGFSAFERKTFSDTYESAKDTPNFYAALKPKYIGKNLCFAGHVDVVPSGKEFLWKYPPFEPTLENGILYGRGASDMKTAIAAFIVGCGEFLAENSGFLESEVGNISILLTADEEGDAINGTQKMLKFLWENGYKFDDCIVGEPTSSEKFGDTIKIGRRGSANFHLEVIGVQGHVAYPQFAKNPIYELGRVILALKNHVFDQGNADFSPTNLEVTSIGAENSAGNVIPQSCNCSFNIRFNNTYTSAEIVAMVRQIVQSSTAFKIKLNHSVSGEAFLAHPSSNLRHILAEACESVTGISPKFSTTGGTSDARFIKNYANVCEFGALNATAHKIDECVQFDDIKKLSQIYKKFLELYFISNIE